MQFGIDKCSFKCYTHIVATFIAKQGGFYMSNTKQIITGSEYEIMKILWENGGKMTVAQVTAKLSDNDWTASTVSTFLQRLLKKGVVLCEKKGKTNLYFPGISQDKYDFEETENFIAKIYKGSAKSLVAALFENKKLSKDDVSELKKMFELE